jgi:hypothetical protein
MTGHADGGCLLPGRLGQCIRLFEPSIKFKAVAFSLSPLYYTFVKFKAREKSDLETGARQHGIKGLGAGARLCRGLFEVGALGRQTNRCHSGR